MQRIHDRERSRFTEQDEAEDEVQNDEDSSPPESVEEKQDEEMSLLEKTLKQLRELDFNDERADEILRDWVAMFSSPETSEEFRQEFSKAGGAGFLSESILTSELKRMEEAPYQIQNHSVLLVQLFDHLLQPLDHEGYGWFTEQVMEIASNMKRSRALSNSSKTKLIGLLKNILTYLQKQAKHGEEKIQHTPFTPPSIRLFRSIPDTHLESLDLSSSVDDLDLVAQDWHTSKEMVSGEFSSHGGDEGPSHEVQIDLFREIWDKSQEGSKGVHADLKSARGKRKNAQKELERIQNETYAQRDQLLERKKAIEIERLSLEARRKALEEELRNIENTLGNLNTEHMSISERVTDIEAKGEPALEKYKTQLDSWDKRISEKNSELACFDSVGGIANKVMEQLQNKRSGTRAEQAQWRAKMDEEFIRNGEIYQSKLDMLKVVMDKKRRTLEDQVAKYRDLERDSFLSRRDLNDLKKLKESQETLLNQVQAAWKEVEKEVYDTQFELKQRIRMQRAELASASTGWNSPFASLPPASHNSTPPVIFDTPSMSPSENYGRKPPRNVGSIGVNSNTWASTPVFYKAPSLSKPPQSSYHVYDSQPPTASLQTLDTFQDQIQQDPFVDSTYEDAPLEPAKEEEPISPPMQQQEKSEPIRAPMAPPVKQRKKPPVETQRVAPRSVAGGAWNQIAKMRSKQPAGPRIQQVKGLTKTRNSQNRSRGGGRNRGRSNKRSERRI